MGCTNSQYLSYQALCYSIPGLLVENYDRNLFFSMCKIERASYISNVLHPPPTQLFYVVVSGEVNVLLSAPGVKPIVAQTFTAGETIHFFNAPLSNIPFKKRDDCLRNGDMKLSLQLRRTSTTRSQVIGMNRKLFDEFSLQASSNLHAITSFVNMNMTDLFLNSQSFLTMTSEQAYMFGPLLKIRLEHADKEVGPHLSPVPISHTDNPDPEPEISTVTDKKERGYLIMLLHGGLVSVPVRKDITTTGIAEGDHHTESPTSVPEVFRPGSEQDKSQAEQETSYHSDAGSSVMSTVHDSSRIALPRGSIIGSDQYFVSNPDVRIRSYLTTAPSVLGYLSMTAMDAVCEVDPRFKRVFSRNMLIQIIHWLRPRVPLLANMDDWSLKLLSCKVTLVSKNTGEQVIKKGDPGNYAYIVLTGSVKRTSCVSMELLHLSPSTSQSLDHTANTEPPLAKADRILKWASLFGVTALPKGSPYYSTVLALEPTLLLCMSKPVLDQIYYNDQAKQCEVHIRLMGAEVDLLHAIADHSVYALFLQYLTQKMAAENLSFYKAIDKYDNLCRSVVKQRLHIHRLQEKLHRQISVNKIDTENADMAIPHTSLPITDTIVTEANALIPTNMTSKEKRRIATISLKLQSLYECITGLQSVAHVIMSTYINRGSSLQVNLSNNMRIRCEERCEAWCVGTKKSFSYPPGFPSQDGTTLFTVIPSVYIEVPHIDMSFVDLFKETKGEILKVLRDDMFPRWKATSGFLEFIASIQPYKAEKCTSGDDLPTAQSNNTSSKSTKQEEKTEKSIDRSDSWSVMYAETN